MKQKALLALISLLLLVACNPATPPPLPTSTPAPTATATPAFPAAKFGSSETDVTYCTMNGAPQKMDLYYPKTGGPWPVLLYVHGGSWYQGDKAEGAGWRYMNDHGFLVASVNYRLATYQTKFPDMIEDVKCAVRFLRAHADSYNLDPTRIGAIGASAGGQLVNLLGTSDKSAGWNVGEYLGQSSRVQAVVSISGPADFTRPFPNGINTSIFLAFGALAGSNSPAMVAASPVTYITPDDPPFLIFQGDHDGYVPVDQGETLNARLLAAGVPSTLVVVVGGDHSLQGVNGKDTIPSQDEISQITLRFLEKNLK